MIGRCIFVVVLGLVGSLNLLHATQYALLVGVSHYAAGAGQFDLEGPRYDVPALKAVLTGRYGFLPQNIVELADGKATRTNILAALDKQVSAAKPGDLILFYFSGHGTSAFDVNMRPLAATIGPNSGALAPYDLDVTSLDAASHSIIIGRRDLRPILARLSRDARAWVVLDACYSENAVRSLGRNWEGPARAINLVSALAATSRGNGPALPGDSIAEVGQMPLENSEPYPYPNVISFSAASRDQTARDINTALLQTGRFQTIDGKPHGAFTNGFLAALSGLAGPNSDGQVTYEDLFHSTRAFVEQGSNQRPQILGPGADALRQAVLNDFGKVPAKAQVRINNGRIRVALEDVDEDLRRRIAALPGVEVAQERFDLLVRQRSGSLSLFHHSLVLIREYRASDPAEMFSRIAAQGDVERLIAYHFDGPGFGLEIDIQPVGSGGKPEPDYRAEFALGETVAILARVEKPAHVLVLDIDTTGVITVLYPGANDPQPLAQTSPIEILRARVRRPTGAEFIKAFAFSRKPDGLEEFACRSTDNGPSCPEIEPGDKRYQRLLSLLESSSGTRADSCTKLLTKD